MKKLTLFIFCITISLCAAYSQKAIIQVIPDTTKICVSKFAYNPFRWSEFNQDAITKIDIGTTPTKIVYYLDKPQVQSASFGYFNSQIMYITPEDSVVCRIKNVDKNISKFIFTGKNAAHYDFYTKMGEKVLQKDCPQYMKSEDLMAYKERLKKYWMLKTDFLDSYIKGNTVSDAFVDWIKSELQNEYVLYLYQPIGDKSVLGKDIPATYFEKLSPNPLSRYYKSALAYKNIYCLGQNGTADISNISENIKMNYT